MTQYVEVTKYRSHYKSVLFYIFIALVAIYAFIEFKQFVEKGKDMLVMRCNSLINLMTNLRR